MGPDFGLIIVSTILRVHTVTQLVYSHGNRAYIIIELLK